MTKCICWAANRLFSVYHLTKSSDDISSTEKIRAEWNSVWNVEGSSPACLYCASASQGCSCIREARSSSLIFSSFARSSALRPPRFLSLMFDPYWRRSFTTCTTHTFHNIFLGGGASTSMRISILYKNNYGHCRIYISPIRIYQAFHPMQHNT